MEQSVDISKLKFLFGKLKILNYKYEKLEKANSFNIFSVLAKNHDEVNLHSRFIAEILSPKGSHNMGNKFLKAFIEQCGIEDFVIDKAVVLTEYRDIDIFIRSADGKQGIIIEDKIYAGDQYKQLERYYEIVKDEGYKSISIFYLSLDGHEPSDDSVGGLKKEQIQLLSYQVDILTWIERCIQRSALIPQIRETLYQYYNLIKELTNQSFMEEHVKDLIELLAQEDNAIQAKVIADNWKHIRWHTEYNFWHELEDKLKKKDYIILQDQKWSDQNLTSAIHGLRGRNIWYGLMYEILVIDGYSFRCFIERGGGDLYYGITLFRNNYRIEKYSQQELGYSEKIKSLCEGSEVKWLGWNYFKQKINFEKFNEETAKLLNETHRIKCLDNLVEEVMLFTSKVINCYIGTKVEKYFQ